jgi:hypothetical protein
MVNYCCTQKLLKKGFTKEERINDSDTKLGDWYVNYLPQSPFHLVLFVSSKSLLPVVVSASPINLVFSRFVRQLELILSDLQIPSELIREEIRQMEIFHITKTYNRSVLRTMREFQYEVQQYRIEDKIIGPFLLSKEIAEMPCGAIEVHSVDKFTRQLFIN